MREYDVVVYIGNISDGINRHVLENMNWWMKHNTVLMPILYIDNDESIMVFGYMRKDTYDKMKDIEYEDMKYKIIEEYNKNKEKYSIKYKVSAGDINILVVK